MFDFPTNNLVNMQPVDKFQCSVERQCSQTRMTTTSFHKQDDQGKCSALLTREGFLDFVIFRTQCNVSHNVGVVCQHSQTEKNIEFSNNMSDVKVSMVDGFYSLQMFSRCDAGWFTVDDICINIYRCESTDNDEFNVDKKTYYKGTCINNTEAQEQCHMHGGQLAYRMLKNATFTAPENTLNRDTKLSLFFWSMFLSVEDLKLINLRRTWSHPETALQFYL